MITATITAREAIMITHTKGPAFQKGRGDG